MHIANGSYFVLSVTLTLSRCFIGTGEKGAVGDPGVKGDIGPVGEHSHLYRG